MNRRTLEQGYLGLLGVFVLVAVFGFIWPNYSSAGRVADKIASLEEMDVSGLHQQGTNAVGELQTRRKSKCRRSGNARWPSSSCHFAGYVDGERVVDQTFTVSGRRENVDGEGRYEVS